MSEPVNYEHEQLDPEPPAAADGSGAVAAGGDAVGSAAGAPGNGAPGASAGAGTYVLQDADMRRVSEVPLELSVEIGRTQMTVGETLDLRAGSIVTLDRLAGEPVDLLVNGTPIAHGEVVVVDEQFGLRVTGIIEGDGAEPAEEQAPAEHEEVA